jgi:Protein of unknown function (DUF1559)
VGLNLDAGRARAWAARRWRAEHKVCFWSMIMNHIPLLLLTLLGTASAAAGQPRFDAEALAKTIAPFCDEQTFAILHVNLWRIDGDQLVDKVVQFTKLPRDRVARDTDTFRQHLVAFKKAGGKDLFVAIRMADLPHGGIFVVPLYPESKADALQRLGELFGAGVKAHAVKLRDSLVFGDPRHLARLEKLQAKPSPALAKAFAAAGDATAQALLLIRAVPPPMIEQLLAYLSKELGDVPSTVLTRDMEWAAAGVELAPSVKIRLTVQAQDDKTAAALDVLSARLLKQTSELPPVRAFAPHLGQLLPALTPKAEKDRLVLTVEEPTLTAGLLPVMQKQRAQSGDMVHINHLKQVAVAMHSFQDTHNSLPPHASYDKNGKPLLSWRVHLLPFLEEDNLYQQFHLNEPWDSAHNRTLIPRMPEVYGPPPNSGVPEGKTTLMVPVGDDTVFPDRKGGTQFQDIVRGTSNTILIVEVTAPHAVIWTKPDDLNVTPSDPKEGLVEPGQAGIRAVFADGSFRRLPASITPDELWEMFTRGGPRQSDGAILSTSERTRFFGRPWLLAALVAVAVAVAGWFLARRFQPAESARAGRKAP